MLLFLKALFLIFDFSNDSSLDIARKKVLVLRKKFKVNHVILIDFKSFKLFSVNHKISKYLIYVIYMSYISYIIINYISYKNTHYIKLC